MTRVFGKVFVGASWIVLLITDLGMLASGGLYYSYSHMDCHPFSKPETACSTLTAWASDRVLMPKKTTFKSWRQ